MLVLDDSVAWKWFFRSRPAEADTDSALLVKADAGYLRKAARDGRIISLAHWGWRGEKRVNRLARLRLPPSCRPYAARAFTTA